MDRGLKRFLLLAAGLKAFLLCFAAALPWLAPSSFNLGNFASNFHWPPGAVPSWSTLFSTWDAQHYLYLADHGYGPGQLSSNFYPLWPWLIRAGAPLCGGSVLASALLLSNALSLAGLALLFSCLRGEDGQQRAETALLLLLAYPGAFFLCLPFSESLFLFLAAVLFAALRRGDLGLAALAAFLLPLARPQGLLAAAPFWYFLLRRGRVRLDDAALALAPVAGVLAYLFFMLHSTGDAFEGLKAYRDVFPDAPSLFKLLDVPGFLRSLFAVTGWHDVFGSAMDRGWFVLFAACLPALWRRHRLLFWYALPMGLVPAMSLSFVSYTRHLVLVFPVFVALAGFFEGRPLLRRAVLAASLAFQLFLLARHCLNYWVA